MFVTQDKDTKLSPRNLRLANPMFADRAASSWAFRSNIHEPNVHIHMTLKRLRRTFDDGRDDDQSRRN